MFIHIKIWPVFVRIYGYDAKPFLIHKQKFRMYINRYEIVPARNVIFLGKANVVVFEIICMKLRNVPFFMW